MEVRRVESNPTPRANKIIWSELLNVVSAGWYSGVLSVDVVCVVERTVLPDMFNMRLMRPLNPSNDTDLSRMVGSR